MERRALSRRYGRSRDTVADAATLVRLHHKYVSLQGAPNAARIQASIGRELHAIEAGHQHATRGLLRELRADRATIGRIVNAGGV